VDSEFCQPVRLYDPRGNSDYCGAANGGVILQDKGVKIALEFKASSVPAVTRGFYSAMEDLKTDRAIIVAPVTSKYPLKNGVWVMSLKEVMKELFELKVRKK